MSLEYDVAAFSVQGQRETMEDVYYLDPTKRLFIVADGVCLSKHGDEASKLAVDAVVDTFGKGELNGNPQALKERAEQAMLSAQNAVRGRFGDGYKGSTTLTVVLLTGSNLVYGAVGNSRLYVVKVSLKERPSFGSRSLSTPLFFHQLTQDRHSFIGSEKPKYDFGIYPLAPEDGGFLLCTDGLYHHLSTQLEYSEITGMYEPIPFSEHFGQGQWVKEGKHAVLQYERLPEEEVDLLTPKCADAYDNVTAIYALFRNRPIQL